MSIIKINTSRLKSDADHFLSLINSIIRERDKMQNNVAQLNNMWEGPTKEAFVRTFGNDMEALNAVVDGLRSIQRYETQAQKDYEACENKVAQLVDSIRI